MRLLFTGSSGFLGRNILPILKEKYNIETLDLQNADYCCNLSQESPLLNENFDIVLHTAGKAHSIPRTKAEEKVFFDVNYQGTVNLCKGLEAAGVPKAFIFISTVAVYGCDFGENITEEHPLNGNTPYALSKIQAEQFLVEWCKKHDVILSIIRPSLIAGPNPPANLGDMIRGIKSKGYLSIAKGKARKSILMVQDIITLIPLLIEKGGIYNVCSDEQPSFAELAETIAKQLGKKKPLNIPYWFAKALALIGDLFGNKAPINSLKLKKIIESLTFSNEKIKRELGWQPSDILENFKIQ